MNKTKDAAAIAPTAVDWTGANTHRIEYGSGATIFAQGDPATSVMYIEQGTVRLSVLSHAGKEAVIALLQPCHFFGEGCLAGQPYRMATAVAIAITRPVVFRERTHSSDHPGRVNG
jgi:CRP/FNR family cyclic AMP-dependent transcriptional regulator